MDYIPLCLIVTLLSCTPEVSSILPIKVMQMLRNKPTLKRKNCSIHYSAIVRDILATDFFPIFEKYDVAVPLKCKFHGERDIFTWIERNKSSAEGISVQCELCGKQFYEKFSFYEHAKRKHSDVFLQGSNSVCLADFCEIFRCDLHEKYPHDIPNAINCNKKHVDKLRRKCEALMRSCLPEKLFYYVYDQLYMAICSTLTCEKFLHPFQDSVSLFTVVTLSITIPISLFILGHICLLFYDQMDTVDDDDKFRRAQRARYEARNAELDARFYAIRERSLQPRHRKSYRHNRINRYPRYKD